MAQDNQENGACYNCCFNYDGKKALSIHRGIGWPCWLGLIRFIAFVVVTTRLVYENIWGDRFETLLIFRFLTWTGFVITWVFYATVLEDALLNHCCTERSPKLKNYVSILYEISLPIQIVVTVIYWGALYDYGDRVEVGSFIRDVAIHGVPLILLLLELPCNAMPFPIRHLCVTLIIAIIYLVLNLAYTLRVEKVYDIIDWKSATSYGYVIGAIVILILFHFLFRCCFKCCKEDKLDEAPAHEPHGTEMELSPKKKHSYRK